MLDTVEGEPGYDAALEALGIDLPSTLPATLSLEGLAADERRLVLYMLDIPDTDDLTALERESVRAAGPLGRAVLGAFAAAKPPALMDVAMLRRGLHRFYACARGFPPTLTAFLSDVHDFRGDITEVVESDVKDLRRRIKRNTSAGTFVAETLRADDSVRETEIILTDRRGDSGLDYLEYDEDGALRGASTFAAGDGDTVGAVPFACIGCHGVRDVTPPGP